MAHALPLIPWRTTSTLTCREHLNSSRIVQHAALDFFVLGFPLQAHLLLEAVHEQGLDTIICDYYGRKTYCQLCVARSASGTSPEWNDRENWEASDAVWAPEIRGELSENRKET